MAFYWVELNSFHTIRTCERFFVDTWNLSLLVRISTFLEIHSNAAPKKAYQPPKFFGPLISRFRLVERPSSRYTYTPQLHIPNRIEKGSFQPVLVSPVQALLPIDLAVYFFWFIELPILSSISVWAHAEWAMKNNIYGIDKFWICERWAAQRFMRCIIVSRHTEQKNTKRGVDNKIKLSEKMKGNKTKLRSHQFKFEYFYFCFNLFHIQFTTT